MNSLLDYYDNAIDFSVQTAVALSPTDWSRIARLQTVREVVWSRVHEPAHDELRNYQITVQGVTASTDAFHLPVPSTATESWSFLAEAPAPDDWWLDFVVEDFWVVPGRSALVTTERKAARRRLHLLDWLITITQPCAALHNSLRPLVLRLRAFFVTHGNHPPDELLRHRLVPEGAAVQS